MQIIDSIKKKKKTKKKTTFNVQERKNRQKDIERNVDQNESPRDFLIWSHLSYFQDDYTPADIGEAVEEKGKGWPEKRGRIRVFAGYFMQPLCIRYV